MMEEVLARGLKNPQMKMYKTWTGQGESIVSQKQLYQQFGFHWCLSLHETKEMKTQLIC